MKRFIATAALAAAFIAPATAAAHPSKRAARQAIHSLNASTYGTGRIFVVTGKCQTQRRTVRCREYLWIVVDDASQKCVVPSQWVDTVRPGDDRLVVSEGTHRPSV